MSEPFFVPGLNGLHVFSPFPLVPVYGSAVYIYAAQSGLAAPRFLYIGETDDMSRRWREHMNDGIHAAAVGLGATSLFVHLLAQTKQQRLDVETDLRHRWATPLNRQPSPAYERQNALADALQFGSSSGLGLLGQPIENGLAAATRVYLDNAQTEYRGGLFGGLRFGHAGP